MNLPACSVLLLVLNFSTSHGKDKTLGHPSNDPSNKIPQPKKDADTVMDAHAYANNKVEADTDAVVKSDSEGKADVFLKDFQQMSNKALSITARGYTCENECEKKLETGYFWCWLMAGPPGTTWDYCSPHNNTDITGKDCMDTCDFRGEYFSTCMCSAGKTEKCSKSVSFGEKEEPSETETENV